MSPAPTHDSMGYSMGSGGYDEHHGYGGSMGYDPNMHQDLSPWTHIDCENVKHDV